MHTVKKARMIVFPLQIQKSGKARKLHMPVWAFEEILFASILPSYSVDLNTVKNHYVEFHVLFSQDHINM